MRILFMGTPDFSVGTLEALLEAGHEIAAVVTQPDKPKGRGKELQPPPVKAAALAHGLPVLQPKRVRDPQFLETVKELQPEAAVVVAFGQLLPDELLTLPKYGCINVHASLLPAYRGAAPIQWAVIDGRSQSGVTIMRMDEGLDTGDMIAKVTVPLEAEESGGSLFDKLSKAGARLLVETLTQIASGEAVYEKQPKDSPTPYAAMITKQMGRIDWQQSAVRLERLVRGLDPWPSAFTYWKGKSLKIWKAVVREADEQGRPGEVVQIKDGIVWVQTGAGQLGIRELQLEGKKRMTAEAFLRGNEMAVKDMLSADSGGGR